VNDQRHEVVVLEDSVEAFVAALVSQGWLAGPAGPSWFRLAGGLVDGATRFVSDCLVVRGNISIETRLALRVPPERRLEALRLCSLLNAGAMVICSLDADAVPIAHYKSLLVEPQAGAVAAIVDAIQAHRDLVTGVISPAFVRIATGHDASSIAEELDLQDYVPLAHPFQAAVFPASELPEPDPRRTEAWRELIFESPAGTEEEANGLATLWELNFSLPRDAPICIGPVIAHADGTLECYGCDTPITTFHPEGTSGSCSSFGYRPGVGHECSRCGSRHDGAQVNETSPSLNGA
jgi:hypothetical protein